MGVSSLRSVKIKLDSPSRWTVLLERDMQTGELLVGVMFSENNCNQFTSLSDDEVTRTLAELGLSA